jgi:mannose-6-phosphate isomerase-like protein (cupin superfamily)
MPKSLSDYVFKLDKQAEAAKLKGLPLPYAVPIERVNWTVGPWMLSAVDAQGPHDRDEIYIVSSGNGSLRRGRKAVEFETGDCLFVPTGVEYQFERFSANFRTRVIFFGPSQGPQS